MKSKSIIIIGLFLLFWMNRDLGVLELEFGELILALLGLLLCVLPFAHWINRGMKGIPLFEVFCLCHYFYYVSPCLMASSEYMDYPPEVRQTTCMAVSTFLFAAQCAYRMCVRRTTYGFISPLRGMLGQQFMTRNIAVFWGLALAWVAFEALRAFGRLPDFRGYVNAVNTLVFSAGTFSIYYLFLEMGKGRLSIVQRAGLLAITGFGFLMVCSGGMLYLGAFILISAVLSYSIGNKRIPWKMVLLSLICLNFLHAGKSDMRKQLLRSGDVGVMGVSPVELYSCWFEASWRKLSEPSRTDESNTILERARLISMLELVISKTPHEKPFLYGLTYEQIPILFVPRFLMENKPRGNLPSDTLGIYYGVQTEEMAETVAIALGRIAEGWANFGWVGIVLVGAFSGWLFEVLGRFSRGLPENSVGHMMGLLSFFASVAMEPALGSHLVALTQMLSVSFVLLCVLQGAMSRRSGGPSRVTGSGTSLSSLRREPDVSVGAARLQ